MINHVRTYFALRRSVGWIGILLPFLLAAGSVILHGEPPFLPSISRYYHSGMRDVFVGGLCALSLFMFFYSGHDGLEDWMGNAAGLFALGVALFPAPLSGRLGLVGTVHYVSAISLYLTLAAFSLLLFARDRPHSPSSVSWRIHAHRICGGVIFVCVAAIGVFVLIRSGNSESRFALVAEILALEAFGVSWIIEGRALADSQVTR